MFTAVKHKTLISTGAILGLMFLSINGLINTSRYNNISFMSADYGIKLEKRIDEMTGEVVRGTASALPFKQLTKKIVAKPVTLENKIAAIKKVQKEAKKWSSSFMPLSFNTKSKVKNTIKHEVAENVPAPAVKDDLSLSVSKFFHKTEIAGVTGSAVTYDGVIEEVSVNLPDGRSISINATERMVGNVFYYEDTNTNEMKSGMFYEVKAGTYMLTLTNDSQYQGARIELTTGDNSVVEDQNNTANWNNVAQTNAQDIQQEEVAENNLIEDSSSELNDYEKEQKKEDAYNFNFNESAQNI